MEQQIINTALFYIKEGQEKTFEKFRSRAGVILERYGARIERVIAPKMMAEGDIELPSEIHFAYYPSKEAKEAFDNDPDFKKLTQELQLPSALDKMFGFISKEDDFQFYREHGDSTKNYGVALIWYNEGEEHAKAFTEYHEEVCEIMPDFGAHFERFLIPFASANDALEMPNEIHRFYFDSAEGLHQMVSDSRVQKLLTKRDASLKNLIFILGEAIQ